MVMRALTLLACSLGSAVATPRAFLGTDALPSFDSFVKTHGRDFQIGTAEYTHREGIYEQRLEDIRRHNADPSRLWTAGVNHFSDRTDAEFQQRLGWRHHYRAQRSGAASIEMSMLEVGRARPFMDQEKDYMNLSVASEVPEQGGCGSCWAVASSELLKAHYEINNKKVRTFSAQELVSCVKNPLKCGGSGGCGGATIELAMDYVMNNGLRTTNEMPYVGKTGQCDKNTIDSKLGELDADGRELNFGTAGQVGSIMQGNGHGLGSQGLGLTGFQTIEKNKYEPLIKALIDVGPVGVTVAASSWGSYKSGVFDKCTNPTLNHAVLLMGTGKEGPHKTYIVKNSWGAGWGEKGYIRLLRTENEEANCATDKSPDVGVACEGGPSSVLACGTCGILYDNVIPAFQAQAR